MTSDFPQKPSRLPPNELASFLATNARDAARLCVGARAFKTRDPRQRFETAAAVLEDVFEELSRRCAGEAQSWNVPEILFETINGRYIPAALEGISRAAKEQPRQLPEEGELLSVLREALEALRLPFRCNLSTWRPDCRIPARLASAARTSRMFRENSNLVPFR